MPIRSGIGIGEAQVYDTSGLANQFARQVYNRNLQLQKQYEQQQKEQAKVADDMSSLLAKYSTKGLKEADIKLIGDKYQQVKDFATKASTTKDPTERTKSILDAKAGMQSISEYVDNANNSYSALDKLAVDMSENGWRYEPEAIQEVKKLYDLPVAGWGKYSNLNPTMFQRKPDASSLYSIVDEVNKDLESSVKYNPKFLKTRTEGGRIYDSYVATPEQAKNAFLARIQVNPKAKFTLDAMYKEANPDKVDHTDLDLAQFATDNLYNKKPGAYSFAVNPRDVPKVAESAEDKAAKNLGNYELVKDKVFISEDVYGKDPKGGLDAKTIKLADGKPAIKFEKFVPSPVSTPFDLTQISNVFNINDKKRQRLDSSTGMKMTGLGYSNGILNAVVVDKDGVSYSINTRDVPAFIKNGKQYQNALKKLNIGAQQQPQQTQRTTTSNTNQRKSKGGISYTVED